MIGGINGKCKASIRSYISFVSVRVTRDIAMIRCVVVPSKGILVA